MSTFRFFLSLAASIGLIFFLESYQINTGASLAPPLGKFLNPFSGFWQNAESKTARPAEQLLAEGLEEEVKVVIDSIGIPHIFAGNDHDLYFAQGYFTARDRLWQMEFQTHFAAGRISELVGERALPLDRTNRRKGLGWAAERSLAAVQPTGIVAIAIEAYTEGVNAYINSLRQKDLPLEYKLLNYEPEPWQPLKIMLLLKYMANDLSFSNADFTQQNVKAAFGEALFDLLFPISNPEDNPIVSKPGEWDFEPLPIKSLETDGVEGQVLWQVDNPPNNIGSNNWAVSGTKTAEGNPILCGDPHLGLNLPSIWYGIQLHAPGINCMGASLPGVPTVIIGFNDSIAWSVTNARRDLVDWYKIEFEDEQWEAYRLDGEWQPTQKRIEEIKLRGGEIFYDTVTYTHWGPVMYDKSFKGGGQPDDQFYALKWIAHEPSQEAKTFNELNRAKNYQDYRAAIANHGSPAQNFAFASAGGDIAIVIQGKFPLRNREQGRFPMDGTSTANDWQGFIPSEQNIFELNPEKQFVSSANQTPVDSTYPYYVYANAYEMYRGRRIYRLLDSMENITPRDMMLVQNDNYSILAEENLPYLLASIADIPLNEGEKEMVKALESWDYNYSPNLEAPSYFEAWIDQFPSLVWDEMRGGKAPMLYPSAFTTFKLLRTQPELELMDIKATPEKEVASDLMISAFRKAAEEMKEYKEEHNSLAWGKVKGTSLQHLAQIPPFSIRNIENGGSGDALNATTSRWGPSWRFVVELTPEGPHAWGVYPGGQSGNPGSHRYANLLKKWEKGEYYPLLFLKNWDEKAAAAVSTVQFIKPPE